MSAGLVTVTMVTASLAVFSDTETVTNNNFSTGSLKLTASPASSLFNATGLKPGDVIYAPLTLSNAGNMPLSYTMSASSTNTDNKGLAAALTVESHITPSATCNATTFTASITSLATAVTGLDSITGTRTLATGASEVACFKVSLPISATNALQGATTNTTFSFVASPA